MTKALGVNQLSALIKVGTTINAHLDLNSLLESIMEVTTDVMDVEASSLALEEVQTGELLFHIAHGEKAAAIKPIRLKRSEGIIGWVVTNGQSAIVNDVENDPRFFSNVDKESGFHTRSILCVPLISSERILGAIEVMNKRSEAGFDNNDLALCQAIAGQAAVAIENARMHESIVKNERILAIGQTVTGLAHCIKNVLNGIQGGSFMVDQGMRRQDAEKTQKGWEIVRKNNIFMKDLVQDMLSYSKEREPEYQYANVDELIESVCSLMAAKAAEKGVKVDWESSQDLEQVFLDPKGIKRCLLNLVSNAVDAYSENDGRGRVNLSTASTESGWLHLIISDNGCGISEENIRNLFNIFFSTKGSKGTGLGLAVTHKIIDEHNGSINAESELGRGTTFTIRLPMREEQSMS